MTLPSVKSTLFHHDRLNGTSLDPKKNWLWKIFGDGDPHSSIFHPVRETLLSLAQLNPVLSFKLSIAGLLILEVERKSFPSSFISYMAGERQGWHAMEILHLNNRGLFGTKSIQISPTGVSQILPQHSQALPTAWQQLLGFGEHYSDLFPQFHCLKDTFCCVPSSVRNEGIRWIQNPWWTSLERPEFPPWFISTA